MSRKHNQIKSDNNSTVVDSKMTSLGKTRKRKTKKNKPRRRRVTEYEYKYYRPKLYDSPLFVAILMTLYLALMTTFIIHGYNKGSNPNIVYIPYVMSSPSEDKAATTVINNYSISTDSVFIQDDEGAFITEDGTDEEIEEIPDDYEYRSRHAKIQNANLVTSSTSVNEVSENEVSSNTISPNMVDMEEKEVVEEEPVIEVSYNKVGYTTSFLVNARDDANIFSDVKTQYPWNTRIEYTDDPAVVSMNGWVKTKDGYVAQAYVADHEVDTVEYNVYGDKRKSYMGYHKITSKSSKQYKLQKISITDYSTGIRTINGRYEIALGSAYGCKIGQYVDLELEDGVVLPCVVGDAKRNRDTKNNRTLGADGGCAEFIVDTKVLTKKVKQWGDVSFASSRFSEEVVKVIKYDYSVI